jgi:hypothetical protein
MARAEKRDDDDYKGTASEAAPKPVVFSTYDQQRQNDEMKDRERLKDTGEQYDAEEISAFMTEREALRDKHIGEVNELKKKYFEEKAELDRKIGRGFVLRTVPESMLSNETDEQGNRRYSVGSTI